MSGVRAAQRIEPEAGEANDDVQAMVDGLYEILATGVVPDEGKATLSQIEEFLHEHARSEKTLDAFKAFFDAHGLQVQQEAPALSTLELPPLTPPPPIALPPVSLVPADGDAEASAPADASDEPAATHDDDAFDVQTGRHARRSPGGLGRWVPWAAFALTLAGLAVVTWFGLGVMREMRDEVARAQARGEQQRQVIEHLQGRTAGIESSIQANGELIKRMEQTGELVLHSLQAQEDAAAKKPRWQRR